MSSGWARALSFHLHVGMSLHDWGQAAGWDSINVWREAARMPASLTLLQITNVGLMHPKSKALPLTRALQCRLLALGVIETACYGEGLPRSLSKTAVVSSINDCWYR